MNGGHAVILPYPAQGHVIPLLQFSYCLLNHGFKITFINTEFNHERITSSLPQTGERQLHENLQLVSVPDGLGPTEDRSDLGKLCESVVQAMPAHIEDIIRKSREVQGERVTWMIADKNMAWAFQSAKAMGVRVGAFWPAAAGMYATLKSIPMLIQGGFIDHNGQPKKSDMIEIIPGMPKMIPAQFPWKVYPDSKSQKILFQYFIDTNIASELAEFTVCNSFHELEAPVFTQMPSLLPVGPLIPDHQLDNPVGSFWAEDKSCLNWLDEQKHKSVIYVAFGSFTIFNQEQFQEIALGLELTGSPFLWVVRPDPTNEVNVYPTGFKERIAGRGMIVGWSPQQKVLAHPSIACFVSHCGWNSTVEGVRNGVPFLCKPYFVDQFFNERYICDVWEIGLRMEASESGVVMREVIRVKVEQVLSDEKMQMSSKKWKDMASRSIGGGLSYDHFNKIVNAMKVENPLYE